ncbi:MAG: hypothetical protein V1887_00945 [Candidatus Aenigmatarchaeota archaeon]
MSTQTYDMITMLGIVILVAVLIFWSTRYGASIVVEAMSGAPMVLQSSFASYSSSACGQENVTFRHPLDNKVPMYAFMNSTYVQIYPGGVYSATGTARGGSLEYGTRPPIPIINCGINVVRKNVLFNVDLNHYITLNKTLDSMRIGVE